MNEFTLIMVKLTPSARQNAVHGWEQDANGESILRVSVTEVPENGKANKALIKLLAKSLKCAKSNIEIRKGETNRLKQLKIFGMTAHEIHEKLS